MKSNVIFLSVLFSFVTIMLFYGLKSCGYLRNDHLYDYSIHSMEKEADDTKYNVTRNNENKDNTYDYIIEIPSFADDMSRKKELRLIVKLNSNKVYDGPLSKQIIVLDDKISYYPPEIKIKVQDSANKMEYRWSYDDQEDALFFPSVFYSSRDAKVVLILHEYGHYSAYFKSLSKEETYMLKLIKIGKMVQ